MPSESSIYFVLASTHFASFIPPIFSPPPLKTRGRLSLEAIKKASLKRLSVKLDRLLSSLKNPAPPPSETMASYGPFSSTVFVYFDSRGFTMMSVPKSDERNHNKKADTKVVICSLGDFVILKPNMIRSSMSGTGESTPNMKIFETIKIKSTKCILLLLRRLLVRQARIHRYLLELQLRFLG